MANLLVVRVGELQKAIGGYFGDAVEDEIAGAEAIEDEALISRS